MENGRKRVCMCKGGVCRSQRVSDVHDEGTFMTQCGLWHKMETKLVEIQNGGPDFFADMCEATTLHKEDKRAFD